MRTIASASASVGLCRASVQPSAHSWSAHVEVPAACVCEHVEVPAAGVFDHVEVPAAWTGGGSRSCRVVAMSVLEERGWMACIGRAILHDVHPFSFLVVCFCFCFFRMSLATIVKEWSNENE